ncbi:hypothetical protein [Streptomyces sp. ITFR-16]|uniref:hypothetical protein n=1 Tax=Streptomyces sp. ITFR-16 TaxID=3075198 RepID=UPI00288A59F3|nr:hypothetical protein [Streptomyces sp. ITFR-16]WNI22928.1 hypothetical protein RLT58_13775 [Streptomyces sp. ITFR-16]
MTTAVARPGTAARPVRGRTGRRVLHVVLFLGGLLALGLLFGAPAHAEGRQPAARPALDVSVDADTHIGEDVRTALRQPARQPVSRTAPAAPARKAVRQLARPVGRVAEKAVGTAVTQVRKVTTRLPEQWPVPAQPLPHTPDTPSTAPHAGHTRPGSGPRTDPRGAPAPAPVHRAAAEPKAGPVAPHTTTTASHRHTATQDPPPHRGPFGPTGDQGRSASAEAHPPRGGDVHAVASFAARAPLGLVRGAGLPATAAPVRDRSGDIPEFPG